MCVQVRVCTRMGVQLVSTDFKSRDYYSNIRRAITAGYFMQVRCMMLPTRHGVHSLARLIADQEDAR